MLTTQQQAVRIVILGGGYAGMLAAARIARNGQAQVTLIDQHAAFTQRLRFHELLAGSVLAQVAYAPALQRRGVQFVQARVQAIEPTRQEVLIKATGSAEQRLGYDLLLISLGSSSTARFPGVASYALRMDNPFELAQASAELPALAASGGHVLVVGGGLTAIETASELAARLPGLQVTMVSACPAGTGYSPAAAQALQSGLRRLGIRLLEGQRVVGLERAQAWLADGTALNYDRCIWAGGFAAPELLAAAGLPVDEAGRVYVDQRLRVRGNPTIMVAGDSAAVGDAQTIRMGCVSAMPMGAYAGAAIAAQLQGHSHPAFEFGFLVRCISLGRQAGVIQHTDAEDQPGSRVLSGRAGAIMKELIARMTLECVRNEMQTGLPLYRWPRGGRWWKEHA